VNNNPVIYTDPSGHCILICGGFLSYLNNIYAHFYGLTPDNNGIDYAVLNVDKSNSLVAAGLAVQSQWYNYIWDNQYNPAASSYGPAQATEEELNGRNPHDPDVAVSIIENRINTVLDKCPTCTDRDRLILAALAQNGSEYALDALNNVSNYYDLLPDGGYDWESYFNTLNESGGYYDERATGHHNFASRFQLHLFMNNLEELRNRGFELPNLSSADWEYINRLRWGNAPVQRQGTGGHLAW
jgi:hypothetical protein